MIFHWMSRKTSQWRVCSDGGKFVFKSLLRCLADSKNLVDTLELDDCELLLCPRLYCYECCFTVVLEHGCGKQTPSATILFFSVRIWYMFFVSNGRGEWVLGLCTFQVLSNRMQLRNADFRLTWKNVFGRQIRQKSALLSRILFASTGKVHRPRSHSLLHIDI